MTSQLTNLTGEQLLLKSVLDGPGIQDAVDGELDRRALMGRARVRHAPARSNRATGAMSRQNKSVA